MRNTRLHCNICRLEHLLWFPITGHLRGSYPELHPNYGSGAMGQKNVRKQREMTAARRREKEVKSANRALPITRRLGFKLTSKVYSLTTIAVGGDIVLPWKFGKLFFFSFIPDINLCYSFVFPGPSPLKYRLVTLNFDIAWESDRKQVSAIHTSPKNQIKKSKSPSSHLDISSPRISNSTCPEVNLLSTSDLSLSLSFFNFSVQKNPYLPSHPSSDRVFKSIPL